MQLLTEVKKKQCPHQPSLGALGLYIIDTLLLFQCFQVNDHHGSTQLFSSLFGCRRRPRAAILDVEPTQVHLGETNDLLVTSHLQWSP